MKWFALVCVALLCVHSVMADTYGNSLLRTSNNRLNEQSANRDNADRLFDSQNNNRGGYNVGEKTATTFPQDPTKADRGPDATFDVSLTSAMQYQLVFYETSIVNFEWTMQHACGGNEIDDPQKINCNVVMQYMCDTATSGGETDLAMTVKLWDGINTNTPTEPNAIDDVSTNNMATGHHESEAFYYECKTRSRNMGLFHADQNLNGNTAIYTRQDNNGNRQGLECDEERDYFPYWTPTPWRDIAYLSDDQDRCQNLILPNSQNTKTVYKCTGTVAAIKANTKILYPITQHECTTAGGVWTAFTKNIKPMECLQAPWSRDNHLGNGETGEMLSYNWTLPLIATEMQNAAVPQSKLQTYGSGANAGMVKCVFRLRYNISTDDYNPWNISSAADNNPGYGKVSPIQENPYVDVGADLQGLRLAINTAQFGRTFQDRSHVFYVKPLNSFTTGKRIWNLGVRGKRGNIVQTYPAIEYDFAPNRLHLTTTDLVHIQWTGSNTHNNGNPAGDGQAGDAGEGTEGTDRHNLAQMLNHDDNYPLPLDKYPASNMWASTSCFDGNGVSVDSLSCAIIFATSGYYRSAADAIAATTDFDPLLNDAPPSLINGMFLRFNTAGEYHYMNTRNNNFSNRSQKGSFIVA